MLSHADVPLGAPLAYPAPVVGFPEPGHSLAIVGVKQM